MEKIKQDLEERKNALDLEFSKKYQDLKSSTPTSYCSFAYEWKISFYIGMLLNIAFLIAGILIGITLR
jgi:hypothetical protein